jgi:hypothetical protein
MPRTSYCTSYAYFPSLILPLSVHTQMPWQVAPALVIISGALTVTGTLLGVIQNVAYGKVWALVCEHVWEAVGW